MKDIAKAASFILLLIVFVLGMAWIVQGNDFFLTKTFAPKYEQVRHDTFKESTAYIDGTIKNLRDMQFQYIKADDVHKTALKGVILHTASTFPEDKLPSDLRTFLNDLKKGF